LASGNYERSMNKTTQVRLSKILAVSLACSFLLLIYFLPPTQTPQVQGPSIEQQKADWLAQPMTDVNTGFEPYTSSGYTPSQIKSAYNLPASGGSGATIAVIVAYDHPNIESYLATFSSAYGLPAPDGSNFEIYKMTSTYEPDPTNRWSLETCLDVEWAHAIAPQAKILLVEAVDGGLSLLDAVEYATSRPDVVAVSMSWGGPEESWMPSLDTYFDKPVAFFAASGNAGAQVNWPAVSSYVVAVGGTTLNLAGDGSVLSETAWSKSGGGISAYYNQPRYQTDFGLPGSQRSVPDVSYNADSSTGYSVYCDSGWTIVGGTSAGAPQWAAIYALDKSATHTNLYQSAATNYAASFRDIVLGANNGSSATLGYDYVTGLGSPLTINYDFSLDVSPSQGTAGGSITLTGTSFTAGSSVNIEYLNPQTSTWTPLASNLPVSSRTFTYTATAPDLLQNNLAGDNPPLSDSIIYRATDNSNGRTVNSTDSYVEMRRGLTIVDSAVASGIFGNNTDLSSAVAVYNSHTVTITGAWFKPGTAGLTWDSTSDLGTASIDEAGSFTAAVTVPTATTGKHTITVNDGASDFCFELTYLDESLPPLTTLPEGPQIAVFAAAFATLAFVLWAKEKRVINN
jgi:hypothetical protein